MSEHALQVAVAHLLTVCLDPEKTWWSAIDHGAGKMAKRAAGMMRARGVKRGLPDFIVLSRERMTAIELKADKGKLSPPQVELAVKWSALGFPVYVARSLEEVQEILEFRRIPMRNRMVFLGGANGRDGRAAPPRHRRARPARKSKNRLPVVQLGATQKV
jgi:hypothetical protein